MDRDAAILYYLGRKVFMASIPAQSTASMLRDVNKKLKLTVFSIVFKTYESVYVNNQRALYFETTREKKYNELTIRKGAFIYKYI